MAASIGPPFLAWWEGRMAEDCRDSTCGSPYGIIEALDYLVFLDFTSILFAIR